LTGEVPGTFLAEDDAVLVFSEWVAGRGKYMMRILDVADMQSRGAGDE